MRGTSAWKSSGDSLRLCSEYALARVGFVEIGITGLRMRAGDPDYVMARLSWLRIIFGTDKDPSGDRDNYKFKVYVWA